MVGTWVWAEIYTSRLISIILFSALLALLLNISIYKIIGFKGPIILQVVGYLKTVIIFVGGSWIFAESLITKKWIGLSIAIGGLVLYTYIKKIVEKEVKLTAYEEVSAVELVSVDQPEVAEKDSAE